MILDNHIQENRIVVSIVIKALNEEEKIAACIESALAALGTLPGEVILSDSGSTDKTIEIAAKYPIKIVQLTNSEERRCGIGPQLGYQYARGQYVYILDGDMEMDASFLQEAIKAFDADLKLGGVAGLVEEHSGGSVQFRGRKARNLEGIPGEESWLDMGGLYRKEALNRVGYMSNRNLHACEEQELGFRLKNAGWTMRRLSIRSVKHWGHTEATFPLLRKRWNSGYLLGAGEVLRSSIGTPYFLSVARVHKHLIVTLGLMVLFVLSLLFLPFTSALLKLWLIALVLVLGQRIYKQKGIIDGFLILLVWHVNAIAMARGFLQPQIDPTKSIDAKIIVDNPSAEA